MKIAIIGSRTFNNYQLLEDIIDQYKSVNQTHYTAVVSGGAKGADTLAERYAEKNNLKKIIYYPDWDRHGKQAGFLRNTTIIEDADIVFAFWDGYSRGTLDSINKAKQRNKIIIITDFLKIKKAPVNRCLFDIPLEFK